MPRNRPIGKWTALLASTVLLGVVAAPSMADDEELLNRSFYVPVKLTLCEHLANAVLYRDDEPLQALPGTHVFQFTFYPKLKRLEPAIERVRVEGRHLDQPFRTEVIVTPASVYVGRKKIDLDLETQLEALRRRVDVRHEPVELTLRCEHACGRNVAESSVPRGTSASR